MLPPALEDVLAPLMEHPLGELGNFARVRIGVAKQAPDQKEAPALAPRERAEHEAVLEQVIAAVLFNPEDLPPYPIKLRPPLDWERVQSCCKALAAEGCNLDAYKWLCISAFYVDPRSCYTALAATLVSLNTLLKEGAVWQKLGLAAPIAATESGAPAPAQRKVRERLRKTFLSLASDLEQILDSIKSTPSQPEPPKEPDDVQAREKAREKHRHAEAIYSAAQLARRQVAQQGPDVLRMCAQAIRLLHESVSSWLGEVSALQRLSARIEPPPPPKPGPVVPPAKVEPVPAVAVAATREQETSRPADPEPVGTQEQHSAAAPADPVTQVHVVQAPYQLQVQTPISGDLRSALSALKDAQGAGPQRDSFLRRLEVAEQCVKEERPDFGVPLLTALLQDAERFRLDEWEPELLRRLVQAYLRFFQIPRLNLPAELRIRLLAALSRIDPLEIESA